MIFFDFAVLCHGHDAALDRFCSPVSDSFREFISLIK